MRLDANRDGALPKAARRGVCADGIRMVDEHGKLFTPRPPAGERAHQEQGPRKLVVRVEVPTPRTWHTYMRYVARLTFAPTRLALIWR